MVNELLCPAGNLEAVKIAINSGADAVYCAGKRFGARSFVPNLTNEEIIEAARYCHLYSKKIYITLNTLVFEDEVEEVKEYIQFLYENVDAVIVQDYGVVHYIRHNYPDFPIHLSTQTSIHNIEDVKFLKEIGVDRIVLAREVSIDEIRLIKEVGIDLEIFIHGALCFSYSGLCYLSFYKSGRSGNRGSCAQPCRQNYELLEDGVSIKEGPLLSMKDLNTINKIKSLLSLGVTSLKIEGRAKSLEYVASVTKIYRKLIDDFNRNQKLYVDNDLLDDLYSSYSRETTKGYLFNENNKDVTTDNSVKHQGIYIGKVIGYKNKQVRIKLVKELELLDGIRIIGDNKESGLTVTRIIENGKLVKKSKDICIIDVKDNIKVGSLVFKTSSNKVKRELKTYKNIENTKVSLNVKISNSLQVIELKWLDITIKKEFQEHLEKAEKDLSEQVKSQFIKTNNLPIEFEAVEINNKEHLYIPIPLINEMRRSVLEPLKEYLETQLVRIYRSYPFEYHPQRIKEKMMDELIIQNNTKLNQLINTSKLSKQNVAYHLSEIKKDSIINPYFGVCNHLAIDFFRNISKGVIVLSYESTYDNALKLFDYDKGVGYLVSFNEPLMVSKHCPVAKCYQVENKRCGKCSKHLYQLKDNDHIYNLKFHNCIMFIEGKRVERKRSSSLINVIYED